MDDENFEILRFDRPATLMWRREACAGEAVEHFGQLGDALAFAGSLDPREEATAWIVFDSGLLAPEDLPVLRGRASSRRCHA